MGGTHFLQTGYLLLNRNAPYIVIHDGIPVNKAHENAVRFSMKNGLHFLSFICYLPAGQLPAPSLYLENIQYLFQLIR